MYTPKLVDWSIEGLADLVWTKLVSVELSSPTWTEAQVVLQVALIPINLGFVISLFFVIVDDFTEIINRYRWFFYKYYEKRMYTYEK